jgi:hypothetical protein
MKRFVMVSSLAATMTSVSTAVAQAPPTPVSPPAGAAAAPGGGSGILMALVLMGALLVIVAIGVKLWDSRRKREAEAVHLQSQISDALLREQDFFGLAITPTVHAGMRRSAPMKIEVTGHAPSEAVRDAALRIVRDEASRLRPDSEIVDHIEVRPEAARRIA